MAQQRAALCAAESSREEPLFHDPYDACLVEEATNTANGDDVGYYEVAASFIDDKLMKAVKDHGDALVRQVKQKRTESSVSLPLASQTCSQISDSQLMYRYFPEYEELVRSCN